MRSSADSRRTRRNSGEHGSSSRARLALLSVLAMAFMLVPAADALAANFPLTLETEGSGSGTIECEVEEGPVEACDPEYPEETEIAFVAEPDTGSEFSEWSGDCIGQGDECELTIEEATTVAAVFELEEVPLEVFTEGPGVGEIECEVELGPVEACEAEYPFGTAISFVAEPDSESEFVEWGGDCSGNEECELTMDEEHFVSAVFNILHFPLVVEVEGKGTVTSSPEGIDCGSECEAEFEEGETVTLTAEPAPGSEFIEWEGCDEEPAADECEVTMEEEREVSAVFDFEPGAEFLLEVEVEGSGSGTVTSSPEGIDCGSECEAEFEAGETVTLTAEASIGSEFAGWEGCDEEPSEDECEVTMEEARAVTATFEPKPPSEFALTVSLAGTGSGSVASSPAGIDCGIDCSDAYASGTEVTLTATPATGSTFSGWSGACAGTGACKVTMSATRSVTATFTKESTPPPPGPGTAVVASTAKVKGGKALLKLTCTGEGACKGSLKLTAKVKSGGKTKNLTIGKASFSLAAGAKKTVKVKLSGPAKQAVAKKPLKAKVKGSGVRSSTVKLKK
jgi:Divergent InlB B-repeat domain